LVGSTVLAFLSDPTVVKKTLDHLKIPSFPPPVGAASPHRAGRPLAGIELVIALPWQAL
jgi:hypothetical protein